ncbi:Sec-independent protein translocase TatD [Ferrimonas sediminum]|uniref:Sec-independent protein translocase TatD n=1 Tax=Ferrimonas sediminum TaxID=718193 RepID=A0A1G8K259_9GAMM|nr:TatD family hydrolase [Ferrimonas sediminum]SDI37511.1 Sec-independent protein translocase TatD [Ferrimonas sediminum]
MSTNTAPLPWTDIAVNLSSSQFRPDLDEVIARATEAGVTHLIAVASDLDEARQLQNLARHHPGIHTTAGVHPHYASRFDADSPQQLRQLCHHRSVVAVGECGLDYNRDFSPRADQRRAFAAQLKLAGELAKPVLMHCREAGDDFQAMVREHRPHLVGGVLHCFTGTEQELNQALDLDLSIGITGWVCDERRGQELAQLVPSIPADRLLLETDAPYLLPRDLRPKPKSRRNEPRWLPHIANKVAELRNESLESLSYQCQLNAKRLFQV